MICEVEDATYFNRGYDSNWANLSEKVAASHSRAKEQYQQLRNRKMTTIRSNTDIGKPAQVSLSEEADPCPPQVHVENFRNDKQKPLEDDSMEEGYEWKEVSGPSCLRCGKTVYPKEMVEPHKGSAFHEWCFKCKDCSLKLNLRTFARNPKVSADVQVYCKVHVPQLDVAKMDNQAKTITDCTQAPKLTTVNNQIRGPDAGKPGKFDAGALCIQSALNAPRASDRRCHTPPPANVVKSDIIGLRYL